jgi:hypothetical protein
MEPGSASRPNPKSPGKIKQRKSAATGIEKILTTSKLSTLVFHHST